MKREELTEGIEGIINDCVFYKENIPESARKIMILVDEYSKEQYKQLEVEAYTKTQDTKEKGKSLEERRGMFALSMIPYDNDYPVGMIVDFISYWTEHGESDKKMRFEKEKSFGIKRRLSTWAKNDKKFNNGTTTTKADAANDWHNS